MERTLESTLTEAGAMLRLPRSAVQVMELSQSDDTELSDLIVAIEADPQLAKRLLQLANSPVYARGIEVTELQKAVSMLGFQEVGQLAIVTAAAREFRKLDTEWLSTADFWKLSLTIAVLARIKAEQCSLKLQGIFVAGLLHDLGRLVVAAVCRTEMIEVRALIDSGDARASRDAEQRVLGFCHSELGARLCEQWHLPVVVVEAARCLQQPHRAAAHAEVVALIAWASVVARQGTDSGPTPELSPQARDTLASVSTVFPSLPMNFPETDELLIAAQIEATDLLSMF